MSRKKMKHFRVETEHLDAACSSFFLFNQDEICQIWDELKSLIEFDQDFGKIHSNLKFTLTENNLTNL